MAALHKRTYLATILKQLLRSVDGSGILGAKVIQRGAVVPCGPVVVVGVRSYRFVEGLLSRLLWLLVVDRLVLGRLSLIRMADGGSRLVRAGVGIVTRNPVLWTSRP